MSIKVMSWIWENSPTRASERLVLLALADSANDDGICWPSVATIARKANLGKRYVQKILDSLEEDGHIRKTYRKVGELNQSNIYKVVVNYSSLPDEQEFTSGSEAGDSRVVNRSSPKPSVNRNDEPSVNRKVARERAAPQPRDPLLDNELVQAYRGIAKVTANPTQRQEIVQVATDKSLWEETIRHWLGHGWSKMNVTGMLDLYRKGGPAGCNCKRNGKQPALPEETVAERMERLAREGKDDVLGFKKVRNSW